MASSIHARCCFPSDTQAVRFSEAMQGNQWRFCNVNTKSMKKMESRLAGNSNARPSREFQANFSEGFCSEFFLGEAINSYLVGSLKEEILLKTGMKHHMRGVSQVCLKRSCYTEQRSHRGCKEATLDVSPVMYGSVLTCRRQCFTTENDKGLQVSPACSTNIAAQTDIAAELDGRSDQSVFEIHQKPPVLSLGVCGNALIMRVGFDARCFHQRGSTCGRGQQVVVDACTDTKAYDRHIIDMGRSCSTALIKKPILLFPGATTSTEFRADKLQGKTKQKKMWKTSGPARDLFERSFFHFFEILFCHPFVTMREVQFNSQLLSEQSLKDLVGLTNRAAVVLAGVGVAFFLLVTSRMLCVDAAINKLVVARLAIGGGFLWLSLAMKRVSDVLICMADNYSNKRKSKNNKLIKLQMELQRVVLSAIPLLVMCFIGAG